MITQVEFNNKTDIDKLSEQIKSIALEENNFSFKTIKIILLLV